MTPDEVKLHTPIWQRRCADGTATVEDMKAIINHLREGRTSQVALGKIKRAASGNKKPIERSADGQSLLDGFEASLTPPNPGG